MGIKFEYVEGDTEITFNDDTDCAREHFYEMLNRFFPVDDEDLVSKFDMESPPTGTFDDTPSRNEDINEYYGDFGEGQPYDTKDFQVGDIVTVDGHKVGAWNGATGFVTGDTRNHGFIVVDFPKQPGFDFTPFQNGLFLPNELFLRYRPAPAGN